MIALGIELHRVVKATESSGGVMYLVFFFDFSQRKKSVAKVMVQGCDFQSTGGRPANVQCFVVAMDRLSHIASPFTRAKLAVGCA